MEKFFNSLTEQEKWYLGDCLVLGTFIWQDWFDNKPSKTELRLLDQLRIYWEDTR